MGGRSEWGRYGTGHDVRCRWITQTTVDCVQAAEQVDLVIEEVRAHQEAIRQGCATGNNAAYSLLLSLMSLVGHTRELAEEYHTHTTSEEAEGYPNSLAKKLEVDRAPADDVGALARLMTAPEGYPPLPMQYFENPATWPELQAP